MRATEQPGRSRLQLGLVTNVIARKGLADEVADADARDSNVAAMLLGLMPMTKVKFMRWIVGENGDFRPDNLHRPDAAGDDRCPSFSVPHLSGRGDPDAGAAHEDAC